VTIIRDKGFGKKKKEEGRKEERRRKKEEGRLRIIN